MLMLHWYACISGDLARDVHFYSVTSPALTLLKSQHARHKFSVHPPLPLYVPGPGRQVTVWQSTHSPSLQGLGLPLKHYKQYNPGMQAYNLLRTRNITWHFNIYICICVSPFVVPFANKTAFPQNVFFLQNGTSEESNTLTWKKKLQL